MLVVLEEELVLVVLEIKVVDGNEYGSDERVDNMFQSEHVKYKPSKYPFQILNDRMMIHIIPYSNPH